MPTRSFAALCAAILSPLALAEEAARQAYVPPPPPGVSTGSVVQIIFSLLLVLAAVLAVAWLLRRLQLPQQAGVNALKVVSGVAVGQRERVVLVEVNDTWLVIGVAPGQVNALHAMPKGAVPAAAAHRAGIPQRSFQSWLKQQMEKRNG
jgi:flagellar protein FliO/FliZ